VAKLSAVRCKVKHQLDPILKSPESFPDGPPAKSLEFVEKDNGAEIPLGFFNDDQFSEISAVQLYSHLGEG